MDAVATKFRAKPDYQEDQTQYSMLVLWMSMLFLLKKGILILNAKCPLVVWGVLCVGEMASLGKVCGEFQSCDL